VLVDAPCSGLGTLRQHPEIRWRRTPRDLDELAARQTRILESASGLVKDGGRLVYSTCTIARRENDDVVEAFLAAHPEFSRETADAIPDGVARFCDPSGTLRTFPHRDGLDGFFAVRMKRHPAG
jgi:16S rRNA (cytosine967-C5)-methyltransferase